MSRIACLCCTYFRPHVLAEAVESFLRQDYPDAHMYILDDGAQLRDGQQIAPNITVKSVSERFPNLGEKRNANAAMAQGEDIYCPWDDDDIHLPWHLSQVAEALESAEWCRPSQVFHKRGNHPLKLTKTNGLYHSSWGIRAELFHRVGGYPAMHSGQDQALASKIKALRIKSVDPLEFGRPSYIYRWYASPNVDHLSAHGRGEGGWKKMRRTTFTPPEQRILVEPQWSQDWAGQALIPLTPTQNNTSVA